MIGFFSFIIHYGYVGTWVPELPNWIVGEGLSWFCSVQAIFLLFLTSKCQFSLDITNKSKFTSLFVCSCGLLAKYGRSVYAIDILNPLFLTCFSFSLLIVIINLFFHCGVCLITNVCLEFHLLWHVHIILQKLLQIWTTASWIDLMNLH